MAMVTCDCGRQFSNLKHKNCPSCRKPAPGIPKAETWPYKKGVFSSKTKAELDDREITPIGELRFRQWMAGLIIISVFVMLGIFISKIKWSGPAMSDEAELCRLTADLTAKAGGANSYRRASAVNATEAKLHFSYRGRNWTTTFFCD